jgi:2-C-methyl-D-erythritol 4-phosphate cytidylyltransferase
MTKTSRYAIIVAGGSGIRMGSGLPKQFLPLGGTPVLMHTISCFASASFSAKIIVSMLSEYHDTWKTYCQENGFHVEHKLVAGGETRWHSVKNALDTISGDGLVAVHDGVRPFPGEALTEVCFVQAEKSGSAVPGLPVSESVRRKEGEKSVSVNREGLFLIQTPQVFDAVKLKKAYELPYSILFTDDASVMEAAGFEVTLVPGEEENIKITTPLDLERAEWIFQKKQKEG